MRLRIAVCLSIVMAGCVSTSGVTEIGKDTYMVGTEVRGGIKSKGETMATSVHAANAYCEQKGKKMLLTHTESSGVSGWTPVEADIQFMCLDEQDPQYRRLVMKKDPTEVIQVTK